MHSTPGRHSVQDATLSNTIALPAAANTTVNGGTIDLGLLHGISERPRDCEVLLSAPALNTAQLPNSDTLTYSILSGALANTLTALASSVIVQTGNAGAAASSFRFRLRADCPRFIAARAVSGINTADMSAASMTFQLLF